jgi:5-methylcytosine-specific restriction endonuclease McrA
MNNSSVTYITQKGREVHKRSTFTILEQPKRKYTRRTNIIPIVRKIKKKTTSKKKKFKKTKRKQFPQVIRNSVCASQHWSCGCCKELLGECIIIDHKVPLCFGGSNDIINLQALCPTCDKFKTGYLDYKVLKNIANNGLITSNQVSELQQEYFNKIMGGNKNTNQVIDTIATKNFSSNNITIDIKGIKISIGV